MGKGLFVQKSCIVPKLLDLFFCRAITLPNDYMYVVAYVCACVLICALSEKRETESWSQEERVPKRAASTELRDSED